MLTYMLAALAACANATSSVLRWKANREPPQRQNLSPKLLWNLGGPSGTHGRNVKPPATSRWS